jgi:hypothetical protein
MAHRIRESMRAGGLSPMDAWSKKVEVDETFFGCRDVPKALGVVSRSSF